MKHIGLVLVCMVMHLSALAHGNSNIEGYFEIKPAPIAGRVEFSLYLRELVPDALHGVEVAMRIGTRFNNPFATLTQRSPGIYTMELDLVEDNYNIRIYLKDARGRDEIGVGGFSWEKGKTILHSAETEIWFVPRGKYEPIPWVDHISGVVVGAIAFILCIAIFFKRKRPMPAPTRVHKNAILYFAALAALLMPFGAYWDISAHAVSGRESFFQPPHLMIYGGILLCMTLIAIAIGWKPRGTSWRKHLLADRYAFGALVALAVQLSSGPFDEVWHNTFGLDVSVWSPPHVILIFGGMAVCLYLSMLQVGKRTWAALFFKFLTIGGALLIVNVFLAEFEFPIPAWHISQHRPALVFPAMLVLFAIIAAHVAERDNDFRWAATVTIALFILLRLLASIFLLALGQEEMPGLHLWYGFLLLIGIGMDFRRKMIRI